MSITFHDKVIVLLTLSLLWLLCPYAVIFVALRGRYIIHVLRVESGCLFSLWTLPLGACIERFHSSLLTNGPALRPTKQMRARRTPSKEIGKPGLKHHLGAGQSCRADLSVQLPQLKRKHGTSKRGNVNGFDTRNNMTAKDVSDHPVHNNNTSAFAPLILIAFALIGTSSNTFDRSPGSRILLPICPVRSWSISSRASSRRMITPLLLKGALIAKHPSAFDSVPGSRRIWERPFETSLAQIASP